MRHFIVPNIHFTETIAETKWFIKICSVNMLQYRTNFFRNIFLETSTLQKYYEYFYAYTCIVLLHKGVYKNHTNHPAVELWRGLERLIFVLFCALLCIPRYDPQTRSGIACYAIDSCIVKRWQQVQLSCTVGTCIVVEIDI